MKNAGEIDFRSHLCFSAPMTFRETSPAPGTNRAALFALLNGLGISHETVGHAPVFTVEESRSIKEAMSGGHSKNLFLKDKAGTLYLAIAAAETPVDLKGLGKRLGVKSRLSFGKPDLMSDVLGVIPGAVTPFALFNDRPPRLSTVIFDEALFAHDRVWFHPLENNASTAIAPAALMQIADATGHAHERINLASPLETL